MEVREVNISKKKLVWKDISNRIVLKSVVLGHFAMWAVRQSPYLVPKELEKGIEEFDKYLIPSGKAGCEDFMETTYMELRYNIRNAITNSSILSSEPKTDYDFIDLDALARNVAQSVWLEIFYDDGGFE